MKKQLLVGLLAVAALASAGSVKGDFHWPTVGNTPWFSESTSRDNHLGVADDVKIRKQNIKQLAQKLEF